jgi:DNA-binding MarR family transcriptional regulator
MRLHGFLPYQLFQLGQRLTLANADLQVGGHRLTVQEWKILSIIADSGPLMPSEIRRLGTQDKSTISWALRRLEVQGFVARAAAVGDGRSFEVALTEPGWRYYEAVAPAARRRARDVLNRLSREELAELRRLVGKLSRD